MRTEAEGIKSQFRLIDPNCYPELNSYTRDEIYGHRDQMAPGGLYLASKMAKSLNVKQGDTVLDLACGRGETSIYLAKEYGVRVAAVDLWISATTLADKFRTRGWAEQIFPLQLDATQDLPFAEDWFDAIFCMQAFHSFGGSVDFIRYLLLHLREGGRLCIAGTCFSNECPPDQLPDVYRHTEGWNAEYPRYHSPTWWRDLFEECGMVEVLECVELEDGPVMWEDY
ncbi:MAG: SAM-dependent methyltransferase, partial [Dehalococcoidia bacterium]